MNTNNRKRSLQDCHEFVMERFEDGIEYKVGCDDGPHEQGAKWLLCTEENCCIWYCEAWLSEKYDLRQSEIKALKEDPDLFKCKQHGLDDIKFEQLTQNKETNQVVSGYNLRKRKKIPSNLQEKSSEDEDNVEPQENDVEEQNDDEEEDDDVKSNEDVNQKRKSNKKKPKKKKKKSKKKSKNALSKRGMLCHTLFLLSNNILTANTLFIVKNHLHSFLLFNNIFPLL